MKVEVLKKYGYSGPQNKVFEEPCSIQWVSITEKLCQVPPPVTVSQMMMRFWIIRVYVELH